MGAFEMLTVKQVADQLNVSIGAVYKAIQNGSLEHFRFGSAIRITEEQLTDYLDQTRVTAQSGAFRKTRFKHL